MAKHKGEPVGWVTANGKHIPKWKDGSIGWDNDDEEKKEKKVKSHDESKMSESHKKATGKDSKSSLTDQMKEANSKRAGKKAETQKKLDQAFEYEEIPERHKDALYNAKLDINEEDYPYLAQGLEDAKALDGIKSAGYFDGAEKSGYDGGYKVKYNDGRTVTYGWKDSDTLRGESRLYKIKETQPKTKTAEQKATREAHLKNGMKKKAKADTSDVTVKTRDNGSKFISSSNWSANEDTDKKFNLTTTHPYDESERHWAKGKMSKFNSSSMLAQIVYNGKVVEEKTFKYTGGNHEATYKAIAAYLEEKDKKSGVKSRISHY